jgi:hypothetical protein
MNRRLISKTQGDVNLFRVNSHHFCPQRASYWPRPSPFSTIYSDMYSDDDPSPLANPRRAAVNPGFYLSHLPGLARLDFRGEATSTQMLTSVDLGPGFLYFNGQYHDANTNKGFLFGSPTGRDARSYQGWSTYHFSATNSVVLSFRQLKASNAFFSGWRDANRRERQPSVANTS